MPTPFDGMATGRSGDSRRGDVLGGTQQQSVQVRFRQHARVPFRAAESDVDAESSLTRNSVPKTAAKATKEGRRW